MRTFTVVTLLLVAASLQAAEYPLASNWVNRPLQGVGKAIENFAAYTTTNTTVFGDSGAILSRKSITNRFGESGVQFFFVCCTFTPPTFHIQATSVSSNRTRLEVCALPMEVPDEAHLKERVGIATRILKEVVRAIDKAP